MILIPIALFGLALFIGLRYIYSYWDRQDMPNLKPNIPYGNLRNVADRTESFGVAVCQLYYKSVERMVGIYLFFRPAILIRDASLAKRIMTTDFNHFQDRGVYCDEAHDPFSANLFSLPGKRWRLLRNKLTPTFTSGKLRNMLPTILDVGHKLHDHLAVKADNNEIVEMRDMSSRYVVDIIASVFFGFEADSISDPNNPFRDVGRQANSNTISNNIRSAAFFVCPGIFKFTNLKSVPDYIAEFTTSIVTQQIENREKNNVSRKDFIQLLIDLRQEDRKRNERIMSIQECAAQVFLFYIAGSETTSATISFTLHELSQNSQVLSKLLVEIDETLQRSGGDINYDIVNEMKYLDVCVKETLRKYPGLPLLNRECTNDYQVPNSKVVIKKGTQVIIPLLGYVMDPKYFPDPERYEPERFCGERKNYDEDAYYPFGEGPRNCIGVRMGVMVAKISLVLLLSKFTFEATQGPKFVFEPGTVGLIPKDGIKFKIGQRKARA